MSKTDENSSVELGWVELSLSLRTRLYCCWGWGCSWPVGVNFSLWSVHQRGGPGRAAGSAICQRSITATVTTVYDFTLPSHRSTGRTALTFCGPWNDVQSQSVSQQNRETVIYSLGLGNKVKDSVRVKICVLTGVVLTFPVSSVPVWTRNPSSVVWVNFNCSRA